jgi:thymidylate synthase
MRLTILDRFKLACKSIKYKPDELEVCELPDDYFHSVFDSYDIPRYKYDKDTSKFIKSDKYYISNLVEIINNGTYDKNPRPKYKDGTPAYSKFITQVFEKYDISKGEFPLTTLRNTAIKTGIKEILWIYQKQSNLLSDAHDLGINWWDDWNIGDGTIGSRYGYTVKKYNLIDNILDSLKNDSFSRRHIMSLYQEEDLKETKGLYPCAYETIFSVRDVDSVKYLDMTLNQRSNDYIMAGYINKIQYVALMMMISSHLGYKPGVFCHYIQNLHIYDRHIDAAYEILDRDCLLVQPSISLKSNKDFYSFTIDDFEINGISGIKKISSPLELAI